MPRSVKEWVGKTDDSKIPDHVKSRILKRYDDRCYLTGVPIRPGDEIDFDHIIALVLWTGEGHGNRESNIAPARRQAHREKTKQDVAAKAKSDRVRKKHILPRQPSRLRGAPFPKRQPAHTATGPLSDKFQFLRKGDSN